MELTKDIPDIATWRHHVHDVLVVDGVSVPSVERDVYRFRNDGEENDAFSCARYQYNGSPLLMVWGVMGAPSCCRFHCTFDVHGEKGEVQEGPPTISYDEKGRVLTINTIPYHV